MATKEHTINADQDGIPQSLARTSIRPATRPGSSSMWICQPQSQQMANRSTGSGPQRAAFAGDARQDESLLAGRELPVHRTDLSL